MDCHDLARFVKLISNIVELLGSTDIKAPLGSESISRTNARRSIVIKRDIPAGHLLTAQDLTYKRPGTGVSPAHWDDVLQCKTVKPLEADHVLQWHDLTST
jgi:N-acetylneuraminate synthase